MTSELTSPAPTPPPAEALPGADALTDVLYRLADVNVAGADKIGLVQQATADDAAALDRFGRALVDNGFDPLSFEATDLGWSQIEPGDVVTTVKVSAGGDSSARTFSFPMEFTQRGGDWQLTRHTADLLLVMGAAAGSSTAAPPAPTPTR
ncbi:hypothetical protein M2272_001750 [Mycobacterium frederiksbergense]|uniref:Low molecular weight antigen MTB12-like C-terminal domain-containing protein n=1 Tax=Mycolicibacterium frederiksbergense TaxID=117567 RepID=A0ABT6KXY4_9MYCO|nr:hypothetical protein [Mycolicibacterium frederiksbergense]MDH6195121.1 hypothetical protein [Mycolicibacterium frederiksbergense]